MSDIKQKAREMFDNWFNSSGFDHNSSCGCLEDCDCKSPREKMHTNLDQIIDQAIAQRERKIVSKNTSDGYHTFKELYEFRKIYNACLFNEWAKLGLYNVHKSKRHFDGEECFGGGWFIVVAQLPTGQISNHYEMKDWDLFKCRDFETALLKFDGHTPKDVVDRLTNLITNK